MFSATSKTIDALTVVRILKNIIGIENAKIQYGILNGKVDTLLMLPFSFNIAFATALIPVVSSGIAKNEMETVKKRVNFSILFTILIGISCSTIMSLFSDQFIQVLFPKALLGGQMLKIASWSIIFVMLTQTINGALQGVGKVNTPVIAFAIGSIIKLLFNILLINKFNVNGAIYATIISNIVTFLICFIELKKSLNIRFNIVKYLIKPITSTLIMSMTVYLSLICLKTYFAQNLSFAISIIIGLIAYIILILKLKILSEDEILMIPYGHLLLKH